MMKSHHINVTCGVSVCLRKCYINYSKVINDKATFLLLEYLLNII